MDLTTGSPATVLVTGARGFFGRHLVARLAAAGHHVATVDASGADPVDLRDREALRNVVRRTTPDVVMHLGGLLRSPDPQQLYDVNVGGTLQLFEALQLHAPGASVVVVSSSAVYGTQRAGAIDEDLPLRPTSHYGASKIAQEAVALRYHTALGMRVVIARPFNVIGPGQPKELAAGAFAAQIAEAERAGQGEVRVGDLSATRDFVDVRDVAHALVLLAESGRAGTAYNVCTGIGTSLEHCVEALVRGARIPVRVVRSEPPRSGVHDAQVGSTLRIRTDTAWRASIDFETSIEDLLGSYRAAKQKGLS